MPAFAHLVLALFVLSTTNYADTHTDDTIVGKVVAIAEDDTITVVASRARYRIRLYGIDAPERGQDFGIPGQTLCLWPGVRQTGPMSTVTVGLSGSFMWAMSASMSSWS